MLAGRAAALTTGGGCEDANRAARRVSETLMTDDDPRLFTVAEAAERLQVPEKWLRKQVSARAVPFTRLSPRNTRFSAADLEAIIAAGQQVPATPIRRARRSA